MTLEQVQELLALVNLNGLIRSNNLQIPCPFAAISGHRHMVDHNPSLGFYATSEDAIWNCFACGRRGKMADFFNLAEKELGYVVERARERLKRIQIKSPEEIVDALPSYEDHFKGNPRLQYPSFPENWLVPYARKVPRYILNRGVGIDSCRRYEIGFDKEARRVFFPVRDHEKKLVGAVGGLTYKPGGSWHIPKYKNYWHRLHKICSWPLEHFNGRFYCESCGGRKVPDAEVGEGFRKSNFLYGEWLLPRRRQTVIPVIVEGIIDSIKVWQACAEKRPELYPLALFGSEPSPEQIQKIVRYASENTVYVWMDNDVAGFKGEDLLLHRLRRRMRCLIPKYPADSEGSDPGALSVKEVLRAISSAEVVF